MMKKNFDCRWFAIYLYTSRTQAVNHFGMEWSTVRNAQLSEKKHGNHTEESISALTAELLL